MKIQPTDTIVVQDRSSRRKFIRTGTAFLVAGSALAVASQTRADECDRAADENSPKQPGNGSDSDAGAEADAPGCGRRQDNPEITHQRLKRSTDKKVAVAKVVDSGKQLV